MNTTTEHISLRRQITESFRRRILSGELPSGSLLPPTEVVARQFGTSSGNAHRALSLLVAEGLISRRLRRGTIVNERRRELKTVAFLARERVFYEDYFIRTLVTFLDQVLSEQGLRLHLMLCRDRHFDPERIRAAVRNDELQGVILAGTSPAEYELLQTLQLPFSLLSSSSYRNRVVVPTQPLLDLFFQGLEKAGCRKIGYIGGIPGPPFTKEETSRGVSALYNGIHERISARGWETRPEWWYARPRKTFNIGRPLDQEVFCAAEKIFSSPDHPDGLIVYPDIYNYGVLMALAKYRLRIPEDVHLVLYRNKEVPTLCPFPAFWAEVSVRKIAEALAAQLFRSFRGEKVSPVEVGFTSSPENA